MDDDEEEDDVKYEAAKPTGRKIDLSKLKKST